MARNPWISYHLHQNPNYRMPAMSLIKNGTKFLTLVIDVGVQTDSMEPYVYKPYILLRFNCFLLCFRLQINVSQTPEQVHGSSDKENNPRQSMTLEAIFKGAPSSGGLLRHEPWNSNDWKTRSANQVLSPLPSEYSPSTVAYQHAGNEIETPPVLQPVIGLSPEVPRALVSLHLPAAVHPSKDDASSEILYVFFSF